MMRSRHASIQAAILTVLFLTGNIMAAGKVVLDKDPNLMGWWKFDETSGKIAADASPHQRKATLQGDLSFEKNSAPGKVGTAVRLEAGGAFIEVTKYKGIEGAHARTLAVWIRTTRPRGQVLSWGTEDFGQMCNFAFIRGRLGITPHGGYLYMNAQIHDDQWRHVAVVVHEAESPNLHDDVTLYLDGTIAEIHDIGLLDLWPLETGNTLDVRIGRGFEGCLDDLRIYDRALSDEEIAALFRLESNRPLPNSEQ
jgi:hypothetical protein